MQLDETKSTAASGSDTRAQGLMNEYNMTILFDCAVVDHETLQEVLGVENRKGSTD